VVTQIAFQHEGKTETTENGVKLTAGHWYMKIMYYERSPPTSETNFRLDKTSELIIDVEGVIFVEPMRLTPVRATRKHVNQTSGLSVLVHLVDHTEIVSRIEAALDSLSI